jgi:copper resistance protein C
VRRLALVAAVVGATLVAPAPAFAHAVLVDSSPKQGAQVEKVPVQVALKFDEPVREPAFVAVTAPDGSSVVDGDPHVVGAIVSQAVKDGGDGSYTIAYRVVSADGHPVTGEVTFGVGAAARTADDAGSSFWREHGLEVGIPVVVVLLALALRLASRRTREPQP